MIGFLITPDTLRRGRNLLGCLKTSADRKGYETKEIRTYEPCDVLVFWGYGHAVRRAAAERCMGDGGHAISWDLGYWDRQSDRYHRKFRVSIDGFHPKPEMVMAGPIPSKLRWREARLPVNDVLYLSGHILLVGNGPKSVSAFAPDWAAKKSQELRQAFPGHKIIYRPKPNRAAETGVSHDGLSTEPIDEALRRASLVVCRHSNVAVDACRLGVAVVCDDGAAAAIYPQKLDDFQNQPGPETRLNFLRRLAFWQWSTYEAKEGAFWDWVQSRELLGDKL